MPFILSLFLSYLNKCMAFCSTVLPFWSCLATLPSDSWSAGQDMNPSPVPCTIWLPAPFGLGVAPCCSKSTPRHCVDQGLLPVGSTGKTALFHRRSLAGLRKKGMDHLVTHPKDIGVCLSVDAQHHRSNTEQLPNSHCCTMWLSSCTTTPQHLTSSFASSRSLFLSLSSQACIQCYLALGLQRPIAFSSPVWSRSGVVLQRLFQKALCVCMQLLKQIRKNKIRGADSMHNCS